MRWIFIADHPTALTDLIRLLGSHAISDGTVRPENSLEGCALLHRLSPRLLVEWTWNLSRATRREPGLT
jgi:hypothetical protein